MISRKLLPERRNVSSLYRSTASVRGIRPDFSGLSPSPGQITYVLLSRLPLARGPKPLRPFDLHALGAPPAFVLSQDQTLRICFGFGSFHYPVVKVLSAIADLHHSPMDYGLSIARSRQFLVISCQGAGVSQRAGAHLSFDLRGRTLGYAPPTLPCPSLHCL